MKATERLKVQHEQLMAIFDEIEFTADMPERIRLAGHLAERIKAHTAVEEEVFYPALETLGPEEAGHLVKEALEAHRAADALLDELLGSELSPTAVNVLRSAIEAHIAEEEARLFPLAEQLGEATLTRLGVRIDRFTQDLDDEDESVFVSP